MDPKTKKSQSTSELEVKRLREREAKGREPEKHPGPRQNEGISSEGQLYATPEEAEEANPSKGFDRNDVDSDDAQVPRGDPSQHE
jgi:hypothetical protein